MDKHISKARRWLAEMDNPIPLPKPEPWESGPPQRFFMPFWVFVTEVFIDPVFFAFVLFIFFTHIQELIQIAPSYEGFNTLLEWDMQMNPWLYVMFGIAFFTWVGFKAAAARWQWKQDREFQRFLARRFNDIETKLPRESSNSEHFDSML